jgi:hypothetical protein
MREFICATMRAVLLATLLASSLSIMPNSAAQVLLPPLTVEGRAEIDEEPYVPAPKTMEAINWYVEGNHYWFDPAIFPGNAPVDGHPRGPKAARGLVIWNAGHSESYAAQVKVAPIARYFAEQGWDVYNLTRHSGLASSEGMVRPWLPPRRDNKIVLLILAMSERARAMGYRRVILMGEDRGAYESVHAGRYKASVEAIIALSPAIYSEHTSVMFWERNHFRLSKLYDQFQGGAIKLAGAFFENDEWFEMQRPNIRGPHMQQRLTELGVPNYVINQPKYPGMNGHSGGLSWQFARRYGPCLIAFIDSGKAPACEDREAGVTAVFGIDPGKVPATQGDHVGLWQGTWDDGRFAALTVRDTSGGIAAATYQLGYGIDGEKPETLQWRLPLDGATVTDEAGVSHSFRPAPDATLVGERMYPSNPGLIERITLYRAP